MQQPVSVSENTSSSSVAQSEQTALAGDTIASKWAGRRGLVVLAHVDLVVAQIARC